MNSVIKAWLETWTTRFDQLNLRERVCSFLILIVCFLTTFHVFGLLPAQSAHNAIVLLLQKQELALQKARADLKADNVLGGSDSSARAELAALQNSIQAAKQLLQEFSTSSARAPPLAETLVYLLRRQDNLKLIQLVTLTDTSQASKEVVSALPAGLALQGLELTVAGTYPELNRYVSILEQELKGIRWGALKLKSEKLPPELTVQIFLLVIDR